MEAVQENKQQEYKNQLIQSAFTGWQVLSMLSEKGMEFNKYLETLGLKEEKPQHIKEAERQMQIKKANENATRIIKLDKKKGD